MSVLSEMFMLVQCERAAALGHQMAFNAWILRKNVLNEMQTVHKLHLLQCYYFIAVKFPLLLNQVSSQVGNFMS